MPGPQDPRTKLAVDLGAEHPGALIDERDLQAGDAEAHRATQQAEAARRMLAESPAGKLLAMTHEQLQGGMKTIFQPKADISKDSGGQDRRGGQRHPRQARPARDRGLRARQALAVGVGEAHAGGHGPRPAGHREQVLAVGERGEREAAAHHHRGDPVPRAGLPGHRARAADREGRTDGRGPAGREDGARRSHRQAHELSGARRNARLGGGHRQAPPQRVHRRLRVPQDLLRPHRRGEPLRDGGGEAPRREPPHEEPRRRAAHHRGGAALQERHRGAHALRALPRSRPHAQELQRGRRPVPRLPRAAHLVRPRRRRLPRAVHLRGAQGIEDGGEGHRALRGRWDHGRQRRARGQDRARALLHEVLADPEPGWRLLRRRAGLPAQPAERDRQYADEPDARRGHAGDHRRRLHRARAEAEGRPGQARARRVHPGRREGRGDQGKPRAAHVPRPERRCSSSFSAW
jgi:hypothetical protein